jgi:hypothetical protein
MKLSAALTIIALLASTAAVAQHEPAGRAGRTASVGRQIAVAGMHELLR